MIWYTSTLLHALNRSPPHGILSTHRFIDEQISQNRLRSHISPHHGRHVNAAWLSAVFEVGLCDSSNRLREPLPHYPPKKPSKVHKFENFNLGKCVNFKHRCLLTCRGITDGYGRCFGGEFFFKTHTVKRRARTGSARERSSRSARGEVSASLPHRNTGRRSSSSSSRRRRRRN